MIDRSKDHLLILIYMWIMKKGDLIVGENKKMTIVRDQVDHQVERERIQQGGIIVVDHQQGKVVGVMEDQQAEIENIIDQIVGAGEIIDHLKGMISIADQQVSVTSDQEVERIDIVIISQEAKTGIIIHPAAAIDIMNLIDTIIILMTKEKDTTKKVTAETNIQQKDHNATTTLDIAAS